VRIVFCCAIWLAATAGASGQMPTAEVVVAQAEIRELPSTMTLVGTVEPLKRSLVGSEIAGIVASMPVRQGDHIEQNALILSLNDDALRWQLAEARASLQAAEAMLRRWEFEVQRVAKLYDRQQANDKEVYDTQAEHDIAKYTVEERKAKAARLESDLGKTKITSPFTGDVVRRATEVGEWIDRGGQVVEIVDQSSVLVRVDVPESAISHVNVGDPATVKIDALKKVFDGEIRHVMRQADAAARTYPVEIVIDNHDGKLAAGMFARATVISGSRAKVVSVPKDAVVERDGVAYVGLVIPGERGGKAGVLAPVTTGADVGDWIAITSKNLDPGMEVITRGNERMFPFPSPIRIVDERGKPVEAATGPDPSAPKGHDS